MTCYYCRRGAACFAWDESRAMLAAVVKRKLLLFHYDEKDFVELREVALPEAPVCAAWSGNHVCLGCKGSCVLLPAHCMLLILTRCGTPMRHLMCIGCCSRACASSNAC